jgi:hypothetical protein
MCCTLMPDGLDRFYSYLLFKSSPIIGQCPVNMNILAPKEGLFI